MPRHCREARRSKRFLAGFVFFAAQTKRGTHNTEKSRSGGDLPSRTVESRSMTDAAVSSNRFNTKER